MGRPGVKSAPVSDGIEGLIRVVRGQNVMLDADLALLYRVRTRHLNQQVKRNPERFPEDFVFQLADDEWAALGIPIQRGGRRYPPHAFTEPGAGMLASVLRSPAAAKVSIEILRAFARLRAGDEPPPFPREARRLRGLFAAIRDAVALMPGDQQYTTDVPYTYFIQAGTDGPIKIGWTRNLPARLRTLSTLCPDPLHILGVIRGDVEDSCHMRLGAYRIHGEWFAPSSVVLDFIRENANCLPGNSS
jgi:hypothetical protein